MQATLALSTVQSLISQTTEKLQGPGLFDIRRGLLEVALQNVDRVADIYDKAPTSKEATTCAALVELGRIYRQLGQSDKSSRHFLKALDIAVERIKIKKGSDASRRNLALVYSNLGATAEELNRDMGASLDYHLKALALFEDIDSKPMLADSPMPRQMIRAGLSESYKLVGVAYYRLGKLDEALPYFRKSYNVGRELAEAQPGDPALQENLIKGALALGSTAFRTGDRAQADAFLAEARERARKLLDAKPDVLLAKHTMADVLYLCGETHFFAGRLAEARADMEGCLKLYEEIARTEPRNVFYQRNLSKAHYRLGNLDLLAKKPDDARARFDRARTIRSALVGIDKDNDRRQMELMVAPGPGRRGGRARRHRRPAGGRPEGRSRAPDRPGPLLCHRLAIPSRGPGGAVAEPPGVKAMGGPPGRREGRISRPHGYLEGEPDYIALRDRDDFKAMLRDLPAAKP